MLYEFTVENFRSFGEAQTLSLIKGKEQKKKDNLFTPVAGFPQVLRTAAIFGHNASGKSNLCKAFQIFVYTIQSSAIALAPDALLPGIEPNRLTHDGTQSPTRFEIVFAMQGHVYRYGFAALRDQIITESLCEELTSGSQRQIFNRGRPLASGMANITFDDNFEPVHRDALAKLTRKNALVLSSGANLNVPLLHEIYQMLVQRCKYCVCAPGGSSHRYFADKMHNDQNSRQILAELVRDADFGIYDFRTQMPPEPSPEEIRRVQQAYLPQFGEKAAQIAERHLSSMRAPQVFMMHKQADGRPVEFDFGQESQGTQLFVQLALILLEAARNGAVIFIDEFGSNIHPLLAERIIELFQNPANQSGNGQIIFTTHQSELMSESLFRKDQIWLVEKSAAGESELVSLASFRGEQSARSSEVFAKNYLAGRYGGIGNFGPTLSGRPLPTTSSE